MNNGPAQREENHALALQIQVIEFSHADAVDLLKLRKNDLDLNFDELACSLIRDSELKSGFFAVWSDDRIAAINNLCRRPRKPAEDHARRKRNREDVDQRFDCHENIRGDSHRDDVPVPDRCERVDAEEERSQEWLAREAAGSGLK
jgi:hypothetical protein